MRATFTFENRGFASDCEVAISKLGRGTKKALKAACEEILAASLEQVPRDTGTLAESAFYSIEGTSRTGFSAVLGYGGNGNPINPLNGKAASEYMVRVHEDLSIRHNIGKAKFLEDPMIAYGQVNFPRTVYKYASESLAGM